MADILTRPVADHEAINGDTMVGVGADHLTYSELFGRYAQSPFGMYHAEQSLRYANRYAYEAGAMLNDLGDDVHPVRHMSFTEESIVRPLVAQQNFPSNRMDETFDDFAVAAIRFGALVHDMGECEHPELAVRFGGTVGDVNFWEKTEDHEYKEKLIRGFFYESLYSDIPADVLMAAEGTVTHKPGNLSSEAFSVVEKIGYLLTHARAAELVCELSGTLWQESERYERLKTMASDSLAIWQERITEAGQRFVFAGHVAAKQAVILQEFERQFG